jgi:hypothetical protein
MTVNAVTVYFAILKVTSDMALTTSSEIESYLIQASSGNLLYSLYSLSDSTLNLVAYTSVVANPTNGIRSYALANFASGSTYTLTAGVPYYVGIQTTMNAPIFAGVSAGTNFNITPYLAMKFDNQSSTPASSLTAANETTSRYYIGVNQ